MSENKRKETIDEQRGNELSNEQTNIPADPTPSKALMKPENVTDWLAFALFRETNKVSISSMRIIEREGALMNRECRTLSVTLL